MRITKQITTVEIHNRIMKTMKILKNQNGRELRFS